MDGVEHEICNNCKKEIPQANYVMHTMHCSRNITLCKVCNEPIPKLEYESHREKCRKPIMQKQFPPPIPFEKSPYFQKEIARKNALSAVRRETYLKRHEHLVDTGFTLKETVKNSYGNSASNIPNAISETNSFSSLGSSSSQSNSKYNSPVVAETKSSNGAIKREIKPPLIPRPIEENGSGVKPKGPQGLLPCRYCDLELPKLDLEEHENYCGSRTDKCMECGELVMFKNKQVHLDSNHGFIKLKDEPGPRPSWESTTQRSSSVSNIDSSSARRNFNRFTGFDYDPTPYLPAAYQPGGGLKKKDKSESYKEISRRLDWPAPQPPASRRRNPPTELVIPCEFCGTPIPHDDLIQHESGCRPDLAKYNPRRNRSAVAVVDDDDYFVAPPPRSDSPDDEELPCEFCAHMVPASQLWRHQMTCTSPA